MKTTAAVKEAMAEFESKVLAHPVLNQVRDDLVDRIHQPVIQPISAVVGATGVGKTTLNRNIEKKILLEEAEEMKADVSYIPIVRVEVVAPELGRFSWSDFYKRVLAKLNEPLIDKKGTDQSRPNHQGSSTGNSVADLRRAVESSLRNRRTKVLLLDEAQHFTLVPHGRHLLGQMDTLKSLASHSGAQIFMVGTFDLLELTSLNGQTARRTDVIHFQRYRYDVDDERGVFENILEMFQDRIPIPCVPSLVDQAETMYLGTLGCVGQLRDWLCGALREAFKQGAKQLKPAHLKATAFPSSTLRRIAEEIRLGETRLAGDVDAEKTLRALLGMPSAEGSSSPPGGVKSKKRVNVGQRAPVRDKVGV